MRIFQLRKKQACILAFSSAVPYIVWCLLSTSQKNNKIWQKKQVAFEDLKLLSASDLKGKDPGRIWYDKNIEWDDRIVAQLRYQTPATNTAKKTIYDFNRLIKIKSGGRSIFEEKKCKVQNCFLTYNKNYAHTADAILFMNSIPNLHRLFHQRNSKQIYILHQLESPDNLPMISNITNFFFNWTASYRHDSTIVTPYEKFVPYNASILAQSQSRNYAEGLTKKVAWFVSNCNTGNQRLEYAKELQKYIDVDIYGSCGPLTCSRYDENQLCFEKLRKEYKFYLAFENSNCRDYITEKFFWNALLNDVIPVVMGAHPDDYQRVAPYQSYIHVEDFSSPEELASYLHYLDKNDIEYNKYFQWKGTGEFIDTKFECRLCAMLHAADTEKHTKVIKSLHNTWNGKEECTSHRWTSISD